MAHKAILIHMLEGLIKQEGLELLRLSAVIAVIDRNLQAEDRILHGRPLFLVDLLAAMRTFLNTS